MRRPARDDGHAAAFEMVALAAVLVVGLAALATFESGAAGRARVATSLDRDAEGALATLDALPPENPAYASKLEELVTRAVAGNPAPLEEAIEPLLSKGARFEVQLDNLGGGRLHIAGDVGKSVPVSRGVVILPHWSHLVLRADVEDHAGSTALDVLSIRAVLVRLSYVDEDTSVTATLANGEVIAFSTGSPVRASVATSPERASALGPIAGYAVPYDTSSLVPWLADASDFAQPVASFGATYSPGFDGPAVLYRVHPSNAAAAQVSQFLLDGSSGVAFGTSTGATDYSAGQVVTLEYDAGDVPGVVVAAATVRLWSPVGVVIAEETVTTLGGRIEGAFTYAIPVATLWGTHVAELEVTLADPLDATETYLAHRLAVFHVNPSAGFRSGVAHIPPLYEVRLHAWYPDYSS